MKTNTKRFSRACLIAGAVAAAIGAFGPSVQAADSLWKQYPANGLWSNAANWDTTTSFNNGSGSVTGTVPTPGTTQNLWFEYANTGLNTYNDFTAGSNFGNITAFINYGFAGNLVLGGNAIALNGNVSNQGPNLLTINLNINDVGATNTYNTSAGNITVNGVISSGGLTKTGGQGGAGTGPFYPYTNTGVLALTGVNTYTGVTTINGGTLSVATVGMGGNTGSNLGSASSAATNLVFGGGILQYTGAGETTDRSFTINAGSYGGFDIAANNLTIAGSAASSTGALYKYGAGTLTLTGTNLYTGSTAINAGNLVLDFSAAGAPTNNIVAPTSPLSFGYDPKFTSVAETSSPTITIKGSGTGSGNIQNFGALYVNQSSNGGSTAAHLNLVGGTSTAPLTVNIASIGAFAGSGMIGPVLDIQAGANQTVRFTTVPTLENATAPLISGNSATVGITLNGTDWASIGATTATFASGVNSITVGNVTAGNIVVGQPIFGTNIPAGTTVTSVSGTTIGLSANTTGANTAATEYGSHSVIAATYVNDSYAAANNVNVTTSVTTNQAANTLRFNTPVAGGITLTENGNARIYGILETAAVGANPILINGSGTISNNNRDQVIIQNNTLGDMTIAARIDTGGDSNPNNILVKAGAGRLILTASNTYMGHTYVDEGQLRISSNANLGKLNITTSALAPTAGRLYLNGTLEAYGNIILDGLGSANGIYARNLIVGTSGNATIDVDGTHTLTVSGGIDGDFSQGVAVSGALTKVGTGTLVLSGSNRSTGGLVVNNGTVQATTAQPFRSVTGILPLAANIYQQTTFSSGASSITITGGTAKGVAVGMVVAGPN
ncbi:MAG: autotransporter-associated beta strand repeat-containing protein, partial [Phycisphaerae bacterium]